MNKLIITLFVCSMMYGQGNFVFGELNPRAGYSELNINGNHTLIPLLSSRFWNGNVAFYNSSWTLYSLSRMGAELAAGTIVGYIFARGGLTAIKETDGNFLGLILRPVLFFIGATLGSTYGVYYTGKLLGDDGNLENVVKWSFITGGVTAVLISVIKSNRDIKLWVPVAMMPVGAVIGFNSEDISEILNPF